MAPSRQNLTLVEPTRFPSLTQWVAPARVLDGITQRVTRAARQGGGPVVRDPELQVWLQAVVAYLVVHDAPDGVALEAPNVLAYFRAHAKHADAVRLVERVLRVADLVAPVQSNGRLLRLHGRLWSHHPVVTGSVLADVIDRVRNTPCSRHRESVALCVAVYQVIAEQLAPGMTPELIPLPLAELGSNLGGLGADTLSGAVDRLRRAEVLEMRRAHGHPTCYVVTTGARVSRQSVSAIGATPGGEDTVSALERLYDLYHRGGLTDVQFEEAKNRVLGLA
ncbi:MAG: hypothetical protein C0497_03890 [Gemmatimonas sp.]|nr:hypothetical protein [Gemmatimonas sp.]